MNELQAHIEEQNKSLGGSFSVVSDPAHWAGYDVYTVAEYTRYMLESDIYELYKEIHGIRPRFISFESMSNNELECAHDQLLVDLDTSNAREEERMQRGIVRFESCVADLIANGASDRATAVRWMIDAEEDGHQDVVYFEYSFGIPSGYIQESANGH